jgi:hypothetical protein
MSARASAEELGVPAEELGVLVLAVDQQKSV